MNARRASLDFFRITKVLEGLPYFLRVSREGLTLKACHFLRVWIEGLV